MAFQLELKKTSDSRITILLLVLLYIIALMWGFVDYLVKVWGYFNIDYQPLGLEIKIIPIIFGLIPALWIPLSIKRPTIFAYWILYVLTYIPMIIGVGLDSRFETNNRVLICLAYLIGFSLLGISYRFKLFSPRERKIPTKYFWTFYYSLTFVMFSYVLFLFRDSLSFADIMSSEAVYETRFSGQAIQNQSALAGYFIMWLSNALFPFLIAIGLVKKDKIKLIIGIIGMIVMYMTMANKQYLFAIILTVIVYRLFTMKTQKKITYFVLYLLTPTVFLIYIQQFEWEGSNFMFVLSGIFLLRTIYTSTVMSIYYNIFFENHPYTYFSHISLVNKFVEYPYGNEQLGVVVGTYFVNIDKYNANANFFLTDGLSSIGLFGIPIIGILGSIIFYLFDSFSGKTPLIFSVLLITNTCVALMNVSLFTTFISGGLLFFMIMLNNLSPKFYSK